MLANYARNYSDSDCEMYRYTTRENYNSVGKFKWKCECALSGSRTRNRSHRTIKSIASL